MSLEAGDMTLGEFIAKMKAGWGFWRGSRVQRIGAALDLAVPTGIRQLPVKVTFLKGNYGRGPNFHYTYEWRVDGVEVTDLQPGKLKPSTADRLFGYTAGMLPELYARANGFVVSYEY
jgi:hypothetical protein